MKKPVKLTFRSLLIVILAAKRSLKTRGKKLVLEEHRTSLADSILTPADLQSVVPMLEDSPQIIQNPLPEVKM